ncbi:MAG: glycoside hydrolase family 97 catalytic domain-containing protein [Kiritimatiellae bacterium]|nr:glycoside hydrolase family 97 catalytic domain-containing protein [Kiritimatiellia bacterium]
MKRAFVFWGAAVCCGIVWAGVVTSPQGEVALSFHVKESRPVFSLSCHGHPVLADSALGFAYHGVSELPCAEVALHSDAPGTDDAPLVWGDRERLHGASIRGNFTFRSAQGGIVLQGEYLVHDEGVAFRYRMPMDAEWRVKEESTAFSFPDGSAAWAISGTEELYPIDPLPVRQISGDRMLPLTVRLPGEGGYACLLEAYAESFPRAKIAGDGKGSLRIRLCGKAEKKDGAVFSPWRAIVLADRPGQLIERGDFLYRLSKPAADGKPPRVGLMVSNEVNCGLEMKDLTRLVDFAHWLGIPYVQLDWGWYGTEWTWSDKEREAFQRKFPEFEKRTDWIANTRADPYRPAAGYVPYSPGVKWGTKVDLDIPKLVAYAKERGVGICLYLNWRVMAQNDLDRLFATYRQWGIVGLKPGFVRYGDADSTEWLRGMIATAARHELVLDIHDAYIPDGIQRTYPNLLTAEGGGGFEHHYPAHQELVLPFTRCLAGPQDFTPMLCRKGTSHLHSVALLAAFPGPTAVIRGGLANWQSQGADRIGDEVEFIRQLPMNWREVRVLDAEIGKRLIVARQSRTDGRWFVVGLTGETAGCETEIPLDFLAVGKSYRATIFTDAETEENGYRHAVKSSCPVAAGQKLPVRMARNGGFAAVIGE